MDANRCVLSFTSPEFYAYSFPPRQTVLARRLRMATVASTADELNSAALLSALQTFKRGDFSVRLPVNWIGMAGKIADTFNDVVEMNQWMAAELARLSRVVGKQGKINQRTGAAGVTGAWAESMTSVNSLIDDLVYPTRETARVIGAVARGDLAQTMALETD